MTGVYVYLGHGKDEPVLHKTNQGRWVLSRDTIVPLGNTYSSISESGFSVEMIPILNLNWLTRDVRTKDYFKDPSANHVIIDKLTRGYPLDGQYFGHGGRTILHKAVYHFHNTGEPYINRKCDFLSSFPLKDSPNIEVYRSGLYDVSKPINPPLPVYPGDDKYIFPPEGLPLDVIKKIYKDSIFPHADHIIETIKSKGIVLHSGLVTYDILDDAVDTIVSNVDQMILFKYFPGHHYNFSCRDYTKSVSKENTEFGRAASAEFAATTHPVPDYSDIAASEKQQQDAVIQQFNSFSIFTKLYKDNKKVSSMTPEEIIQFEKDKITGTQQLAELNAYIDSRRFFNPHDLPIMLRVTVTFYINYLIDKGLITGRKLPSQAPPPMNGGTRKRKYRKRRQSSKNRRNKKQSKQSKQSKS